MNQYINASIGDAAILNPILSADSASSDIEGKVFEGLIDRDEELRFRGRLATSWKLYEEAFFFVNESADIPGLGRAGPQMVVDLLQKAKRDRIRSSAELNKTLDNIKSISLIPANTYRITEPAKTSNDGKKAGEIKITVSAPARIKLHLQEVDQNLYLAARNLKGVDVCDVQAVDPVSLISHDKVLITVAALKALEEALA